MAYIKNIKIKDSVAGCIDYITRHDKTGDGQYIQYSGTPPEFANAIWQGVRNQYGKDSGIKAHHFIQSFNPKHGITVDEAQKIGMQLAQEQFGKDGFEFIVATHIDTGIIHNHILVNAVSSTTGKKYQHNNERNYKKNPHSYLKLRELNIEICRQNGIPAVDSSQLDDYIKENPEVEQTPKLKKEYSQSVNYIKTTAYDSWTYKQQTNKKKICDDINAAILESSNWEEYVQQMESRGYEVSWQTKKGEDKKSVTYKMAGAERGRRDSSLNFKNEAGETIDLYSKAAIEARIAKQVTQTKAQPTLIAKLKITKVKGGSNIFNGYYYKGRRYLVNPNYEMKIIHGRLVRRRRSFISKMFVLMYMEKPVSYTRENKQPVIASLNEKEIEATLTRIRKMTNRFNLINNIHLTTKEDIDQVRVNQKIKLEAISIQMEETKEAIKVNDKIKDLLFIIKAYEPKMKAYEEMEESKKAKFYFANKAHLQKYTYAKRELLKANVKIEESENYQIANQTLYAKMEELTKVQERITTYLEDIEGVEETIMHLRQLDRNEQMAKNTEEQKEKNNKEERQ